MAEVRCFMIVTTGRARRYMHRWSDVICPATGQGHSARAIADEGPEDELPPDDDWFESEEGWPAQCDTCAYEFPPGDETKRAVSTDHFYRRVDTGEELLLRDAPPGAMWDATWLPDNYRGPDGRALMLR